MKLAAGQLVRHLERDLAAAYFIAGEEPLLLTQALARLRRAARQRGFTEHDLHVVERGFRWAELEGTADNLSLFGERRILELRLSSPRPGDAGARCIRGLVERPDPDRLLIVSVAAKLDAPAARSAWVKSLETHGVRIDVWPVDRVELPRWIGARALELKLKLSKDAIELLADRVEGNLLAAEQELTKLALTAGDAIVDERAVLEAVANSARFDVFRLTEAVVQGQLVRSLRVLEGLRVEGVQPVLVSWALGREIALLAKLKFAVLTGASIDQALARHGIWRRRQPGVKRAVARLSWAAAKALVAQAAEVDSVIKGARFGRPWDALAQLVVAATRSPA